MLTIRREGKPIDLFMVELQQMQHKTDIDTKYVVSTNAHGMVCGAM